MAARKARRSDSGQRNAAATGRFADAAKPRADHPRFAELSIGGYLIDRLQDYGVKDLFGIPGDFVLQFYGMLEESPIRVVGTTREDCAGYAADGYARVHGIGAVCVTYCVGGLSLCNSIAGAYAEKSPVIVISGAPGIDERRSDPLLHHRVRDFSTQREVFEKITVASAQLDDALTAFVKSIAASRLQSASSDLCIWNCLETVCRRKRCLPTSRWSRNSKVIRTHCGSPLRNHGR